MWTRKSIRRAGVAAIIGGIIFARIGAGAATNQQTAMRSPTAGTIFLYPERIRLGGGGLAKAAADMNDLRKAPTDRGGGGNIA